MKIKFYLPKNEQAIAKEDGVMIDLQTRVLDPGADCPVWGWGLDIWVQERFRELCTEWPLCDHQGQI